MTGSVSGIDPALKIQGLITLTLIALPVLAGLVVFKAALLRKLSRLGAGPVHSFRFCLLPSIAGVLSVGAGIGLGVLLQNGATSGFIVGLIVGWLIQTAWFVRRGGRDPAGSILLSLGGTLSLGLMVLGLGFLGAVLLMWGFFK